MPVTRSWENRTALNLGPARPPVPVERRRELWWMLGATLLIAASLAHAFLARTQNFPELQSKLDRGELLSLNSHPDPATIEPFLAMIQDGEDRSAAAAKLARFLSVTPRLPNAGALSRLRRGANSNERLLPISALKSLVVVRTPAEFTRSFGLWIGLYFGAFWIVHLAWRFARFRADAALLPSVYMLTGLGLTLAVSLRDPLRDTLEFERFAWGVAAGCGLLLLPLLRVFDYRQWSRWVYTPLLIAFGLFLALLRFGSGPTGSDSKVNLGPFQPVELIKILIVFFLAGYFARRWEWLRELSETRLLPRRLHWLEIPRLAHALPVMFGVALALVMFFVLKDLGPALVTGFLFLSCYAVARGRAALALLGIAILIGGVAIGYHLGKPPTVVDRISMWLSPWDNEVRGGDQLAHAEWALATGGPLGSGPGWGDPAMIPAGHTDLVLPAIGEEWGFAGVVSVLLLFALIYRQSLRAALNASGEYAVFLGLGLATLLALEMLLITGGALGAIPLSGVVSPFLSNGNTAMLSNFLILAIIAGISAKPSATPAGQAFRKPALVLTGALGAAALGLVFQAGSVQLVHDEVTMARDTRVFAADGIKRAQHNPRLNSLARELTRGTILDRNGIILASSNWREIESHRAALEQLGADIAGNCSRLESRCYPFGRATFHLLGDLRTAENFHASNASPVEHDQAARLQGFASYSELARAVRYRHQPHHPVMEALRSRDRSVRTSIDLRLQLKAREILERHLQSSGRERGALVVMNAATGDLLALASAPYEEALDRARYGQYPPGSTFKLVTAIAALRLDPALERKTFHCSPLPGGRVGAIIPGWNRPIRDDIGDSAHGALDMARALTVSCNAYFAQLGVNSVGSKALADTARLLEIPDADPVEIKKMLPFAAYGQGPILMTPFKMARVSALIARGGEMPQGRWVIDAGNDRNAPPKAVLSPELAGFLAESMRSVVTSGTGRRAMAGLEIAVAGKTGTAQVDEGQPHSWFTGFAPYDAPPAARIAFAVVIEHGGYGAQVAAPVARDLVAAARDLGIIAAVNARR